MFLFQPTLVIVDPICTFLFSILVLGTTYAIIKDALVVLMEGKKMWNICLVLCENMKSSVARAVVKSHICMLEDFKRI